MAFQNGDELRNKILDEAIGIIAREGLRRMTMRGLARRLGLAPSTLYQHFDGKADLERQIASHGFLRLGEAIGQALEIEDPFEAVAEISRRYFQFGLSNPELYRLMFQTLGSLRTLGLEDDPRVAQLRARTVAVYERGMSTGAFRPVDPDVEIAVRWATMHGFVQLVAASRLPDRYAPDLQRLQEVTIEMMLSPLRP